MKSFLAYQNARMIGPLETKVKKVNAGKVALKLFPNWRWHHNSNSNTKIGIWVAWKLDCYDVKILQTLNQLIHYEATQLHSKI